MTPVPLDGKEKVATDDVRLGTVRLLALHNGGVIAWPQFTTLSKTALVT